MRETMRPPSEFKPGNVQPPFAVDVQHVSLSNRGRQMLDNLSLQIPFGVTAGLVGPNGAGKRQRFDCLAG